MAGPQKHREGETVRLLKEPLAEESLDKLRDAGCDRESLVRLLLAVSTLVSFNLNTPQNSRYIFPSGKKVRKLVADIEQLATRIEQANADPIVSPAVVLDALTRSRSPGTDLVYKRQILAYSALPVMLSTYARDLSRSYKFVQRRIGPKRFSFERYLVLKLLEYVVDRTGQPHYQPVQCLLESAFRVTAGEATSLPKLLESAEALKQLWARSLKYGFRKKKKSDTPHPILKLKP